MDTQKREIRSLNRIISYRPTSKPNYEMNNSLLLLSQYDTRTSQEKSSNTVKIYMAHIKLNKNLDTHTKSSATRILNMFCIKTKYNIII
jgi:hypothetical protein